MSVSELHRLLRKLTDLHANRAMGELNGVLWLLDGCSAQFALLIDALRSYTKTARLILVVLAVVLGGNPWALGNHHLY
ncbi:hypothetical protein [Deefgea salmonis]|uniref:Uncharacterized protein n=1 Tax=Deefgea salmonis TaxID=2875502 RepID=A0ABS8BLH0_9NEIS|nr:hypothetical protein [Deefgea salmonis]MCB5196578.1 hypothetical protein [Deefgea salmonis]